jgi:TolA-binding protein
MSENLRQIQRRVLLAALGSSAASLALSKVTSSQTRPTSPLQPNLQLRDVQNRTVTSLTNLSSQRLQRVDPDARSLTVGDFQTLANYKFTPRTRNLTFREFSSLVQALEEQYGATNSLSAIGRTSAGSCCCCCTCCCKCIFDCDDVKIQAPTRDSDN